ncbi:MAG: polysaccharide lyase family protein [Verrucomicrobiota bacterium]|nr:polysaccharide lyase family protein [Limisphaera sp.]MDW8380847.1 polysaccharide lyase family protein [Verrucomicrobiota bacterium]
MAAAFRITAANTDCYLVGPRLLAVRRLAWGLALATSAACFAGQTVQESRAVPVMLTVTNGQFILENGLVTARIEQASGVLVSLRYAGLELLAQRSPGGALGGYWSWVGRMNVSTRREGRVRIDPASNGGAIAEVATEFLHDPSQQLPSVEMSVRYAMRRGEPCLYLSAVWRHRVGAPPLRVGEARYALKLNPDVFDFLSVDERRQRLMPAPADWDLGQPTNLKEARRLVTGRYAGTVEHKYAYAARLYEVPAYGWGSTRHRVGVWLVQPSFESLAGGPTKVELTGHLDVNPGGTPTLLYMWLGSHYGGSSLVVESEEAWSKFVGPVVLYCNQGAEPTDLWRDALARARAESAQWPYGWVQDPEYPPACERATVRGRILLGSQEMREIDMRNLWVGVTAPDYPVALVPALSRYSFSPTGAPVRMADGAGPSLRGRAETRFGGFPAQVDWQRDAKYYQFWTRANSDGSFEIRHVRPGRWVLRAFADGLWGELQHGPFDLRSGEVKDLGCVKWPSDRLGDIVWQIGVPNRSAREFRHGDHYWQWGLYLRYPEEFPRDVDFEVGRSDWRRDWNYVQPPRIVAGAGLQSPEEEETDENSDSMAGPSSGRPKVESTTWTIRFQMPRLVRGRAVLRLAFCGAGPGCRVEVSVNDRPIGDTGLLPYTGTMHRDGIEGYWTERRIWFDAAWLRLGENCIRLHVPATIWTQGVLYDCLRLEVLEERDLSSPEATRATPEAGPSPG